MSTLMTDMPVPSLTDLVAHFTAQGHMEGLMAEDVGGAPAHTMNFHRCLLVPTAWAPYFLPEPTAPGTALATVEKLASMLADPVPADFYQAWCRAVCVCNATSPQQPTLALAAKPQVQMLVEVSQFAEQKAVRVFNFTGTRQQAQIQLPVGAGTLHEILFRLVEKQGGQTHQAPPSAKGLRESEKRLLAMWNMFKVAEWVDQAPAVFKQ
eukprot:386261-Ditylum_brightwellii.AAC.1